LDGGTLEAYFSFFRRFGTHVFIKCTMGGMVSQYLATEETYWSKKTIEEVTEQAENTFMVGVERSKKDRFKVDPKFL